MRFFGIYAGHNSSVTCFNQEGELLFYLEAERISRTKNDHCLNFRINETLIAAGLDPISKDDYIFINITYVNHAALFDALAQISHTNLQDQIGLFNLNVAHVSHHRCHIAASWMYRPLDTPRSLFIALDGAGCKTDYKLSTCYALGYISETELTELESDIPFDQYSSLRVIKCAMPGTNYLAIPGKLMGLAGYLPSETFERLPYTDQRAKQYADELAKNGLTESLMAKYANEYYNYIEDVKELVKKKLDQYKPKSVVVGGGTFLALELNNFIRSHTDQLVFGPAISDTGMSLGAAAYGFFLVQNKWPKPLATPFIQWGFREARSKYKSVSDACRILTSDKVIGLVYGLGEAGPRALGHRSILAIPSKKMAERVSLGIKQREYYRPIAPIVTDTDFPKLFEGFQGRYMQYSNKCTNAAKELTPGIVHKDGSARAQVLHHEDNPWLYELLVEVGKVTGAECLINTSLNAKGLPICNSLQDAVKELGHIDDLELISFGKDNIVPML